MSTRCAIIAKVEEEWRGIYIHHDGYLVGVGRTLHKHYRDHAKVLALISRGDRSSLESDPMSATAYVDRGEDLHVERGPHPSAVAHAIGERIVYVWDGKEWFQGLKGKPLSKAIREIDARIRWTSMTDDEANEYLANLEDEVATLRRGWKELAEAPHPRRGMRQSLGGLIARVSEILEGKADARTELDYGSGYAFTLREMHRNLKEVWNRRGEPGIVSEFGTLYCLDTEEPAQEVEDPDDEDEPCE